MRGLRGIRAALSIGVSWAIAWSIGRAIFAVVGGLNGILFSVVLATLPRRLRDRLRLPLVGAFGAFGGAVPPVAVSLAFLTQQAFDVSDAARCTDHRSPSTVHRK